MVRLETVARAGRFAGALAGAQLGLTTYHVLEEAVHADIPDDVWDEQIGVMADVLEAAALAETVAGFRSQNGQN